MRPVITALVVLLAMAQTAWADPRPFVRGSWQALLESHAGRPLVVHFWSLTCAPCLAELPQWRETMQGAKARFILVSTDPPADQPKAERTLKRAGLEGIESWSFAESHVERLRFEIDRDWRGELPMTVLVAPSGERQALTGTISRQDIRAWMLSQDR